MVFSEKVNLGKGKDKSQKNDNTQKSKNVGP